MGRASVGLVVADGALWIWKRIQVLFLTAQAVLDHYPCRGYIHHLAETQYSDRPAKALEWGEVTMARLFWDEIAGVIWGLERMQLRTEEAAAQITKGLPFLDQHQNRIKYGSGRKGGYPIGRGGLVRPIRASAMCASNGLERGGMSPMATRYCFTLCQV